MQSRKELQLIGYLIENKVLYLRETRRLMSLDGCGENILLRKTMSHVLEYLIENATVDFVTDAELMDHVWDKNGLSSSTQRVWQVMSNFKSRLFVMGVSDNFILRVCKKGYLLKSGSIRMIFSANVDSDIEDIFNETLSDYESVEIESRPSTIIDC